MRKPQIKAQIVRGKRMWVIRLDDSPLPVEAYANWNEAIENALTLNERLRQLPW